MKTSRWNLIVFAAFFLLSAAASHAKEDAAAKAEADLIAREDEQARRLDGESPSPLVHFDAKGKLALLAEDDPERKNNIVGTFSSDKGTFLVKTTSDVILKLIAPYDKKEVTLIGKLRGEGKYFIVDGVGGGGAPPAAKTNKKRI
jgi:hypothetical protein